MFVADAIGHITALAEVLVEPAKVEELRDKLQAVAEALDEDNFRHDAPIGSQSFGTVPAGFNLSHHHSLAQQIVADTLDGIRDDITAYVVNVVKSAQVLVEVDKDSAEDMKKRHEVLEQFRYLQRHSHGESNNQGKRDDLEHEVNG